VAIAVVTGNPKAASRTLSAATMVAEQIGGTSPDVVIDVVGLGAGLLGWGDQAVKAAVESVQRAQLVIVASPTYKATYTGLLKLFLDQFPANGLTGVVAVPLMLGGAMTHALAPEVFLKPVLVELGATCPTRALFLLETDFDNPDVLAPWLVDARPQLLAAMGTKT
jgi:FMN reductase